MDDFHGHFHLTLSDLRVSTFYVQLPFPIRMLHTSWYNSLRLYLIYLSKGASRFRSSLTLAFSGTIQALFSMTWASSTMMLHSWDLAQTKAATPSSSSCFNCCPHTQSVAHILRRAYLVRAGEVFGVSNSTHSRQISCATRCFIGVQRLGNNVDSPSPGTGDFFTILHYDEYKEGRCH